MFPRQPHVPESLSRFPMTEAMTQVVEAARQIVRAAGL